MQSEKPLPLVYLDETWIYQHGTKAYALTDGTKESCRHAKASEGKRFIVLHAGGKMGFLPRCNLLFSSQSNSADYHHEMNTENFMKWTKESLLPALAELKEPHIIVMDNAPYHSKDLEEHPTSD